MERTPTEQWWYSEYVFDSLDDFLEWRTSNYPIANKITPPFTGFIYRGISKGNTYKLIPSALRTEANGKVPCITKYHPSLSGNQPLAGTTNMIVIQSEYSALKQFYCEANKQGLFVPTSKLIDRQFFNSYGYHEVEEMDCWYDNEMRELAAFAQHYGIPTRLLDWTFDFNVALYMALSGNIKNAKQSQGKENYAIWAFDVNRMETVYKLTGINCPIQFFVPKYKNNQNIQAQKGLVSYQKCEKSEMSQEYYEADYFEILANYFGKISKTVNTTNESPVLYKISFSPENALDDFNYISTQGYTAATMYPGYDGVVNWIKEQHQIGSYDHEISI